MKLTQNYSLKKPDLSDVADIEILNGNMDILDTQLKSFSTLLDSKINLTPTEFSGTMSNLLVFHGAGNVQTHTIGWKTGKICYFNFEVYATRNKTWNHNDTIFTIPLGFRPKYPTIVNFSPRRKIQLDCRFILNPDGRCWLHSSESDGRKYTEGDFYSFSSFYISEI